MSLGYPDADCAPGYPNAYLGLEISCIRIDSGETEIKVIPKFPEPTDVHSTRVFLGLVSIFRRCVYKFAEITSSLYDLLNQNSRFSLGKSELHKLHMDASSKDLAAMLLRNTDDIKLYSAYVINRRTFPRIFSKNLSVSAPSYVLSESMRI